MYGTECVNMFKNRIDKLRQVTHRIRTCYT